jgi:hypothetical protein
MKKKIMKGIIIALTWFVIIFAVRLVFELTGGDNDSLSENGSSNYGNDAKSRDIRNYASFKYQLTQEAAGSYVFDQKYEMIADILSRTPDFENDRDRIMELIKQSNAVIQLENSSLASDLRSLNLTIGVLPDNFDAFIGALREKIKILRINIEKRDKTGEYKTLKASKASLEKTRDSLVALKSRQGKIQELVDLEYKILEVEKEIQGYGVSLGEFDVENEFCTVEILLQEVYKKPASFPVGAIFNAFSWACGTWFLLIMTIVLAGFGTLIITVVIEKARKIYGDMVKGRK